MNDIAEHLLSPRGQHRSLDRTRAGHVGCLYGRAGPPALLSFCVRAI